MRSLAHNIVHGNKKQNENRVLQAKLRYGKYFEPVALKNYENSLRINGYKVVVEPCGFVIDENNFVLGCTPDGKVLFDGEFGILEIKCPEQFSNVDPKNICFIAKKPSLVYDEEHIKINKDHPYYKQIQMQLALTTQTWCDFVCYTSKGLVIDRVAFDEHYWSILQREILEFYFNYMLDEIITKST